jgi:hypothetical protein
MKLCALSFALVTSVASASEIWEPPAFGGEIARQFPKHPTKHIYTSHDGECHLSQAGTRQIGIERTACFGKCPVYSLVVNSDGTFRYHGEMFTKRHGNWHGSVDAGRLAGVLSYVAEMDYFGFADLYGVNETDMPGTFTLVKTHTRKKVIYDYGNVGPARLVAFEDMIDRLLEGAKWKRD